ncbi:MAG: VOC family protein [Pseudomonadota bacterium]
MQSLTPYLQMADSAKAIAWYSRVFDAVETRKRLIAPDGKCMNAEIELHGARIMMADEMPDVGSGSPGRLGATSVVLNLRVADADAVFARALEAGAETVFPLADQFYGDRAGRIRDPFGHHWIIATRLREVPDEEMQAAFKAMFGAG